MKIVIILVTVLLYIATTVYLFREYSKNARLTNKLTEMVFVETLGYIVLCMSVLKNYKTYSVLSFLDTVQWVSFFCLFFFLFYYDYGQIDDGEHEELKTKKEIFWHFVRKSGTSNIILTKNKKFIFFLAIFFFLELVKIIVSKIM